MLNVDVDMQPLQAPRWKRRKKRFWKGDHLGGWQICMDEKRTEGNLGQVMPVIIDYPVSGQFSASVSVLEPDPDFPDESVEVDIPQWQYKGFIPVTDERFKSAKPSKKIVDALLERAMKEIEATGDEKKLKPEEVREEQDAMRTMVYEANGFQAPEKSKLDKVKARRRKEGLK